MVQFHALGGVAVSDGDRALNLGGPRQRRLLAMLLIHRNTVVSTDRLTDAVFAGEPTPGASTTLRSYVARMRRVIECDGSAVVITQAPGYVLQVPDDAFDVSRFEAALAEARSVTSRGEPGEAVALLRAALEAWRGDPYAEFDEDWVRPEAQRLSELRLVAQEELFGAELAYGRASAIIPELEAAVGRHPLREALVSQLMLALYRSGRQADALRAFQQHRDVLVEELGLDPTPSLRALEQRILAQEPSLLSDRDGARSLRGYELGERLGTGRDGTVHAARLPGVDRDLVIRSFRREVADSPAFVRAFEAIAHRVAGLQHPAIVPIHDYWREPGAAHLVLRRMHGGSLADRLERRGRPPLEQADVAAILSRIGSALAAVHAAGLVHGRPSPSSVLFDERGEAWLGDFDLAAPADDRTRAADVAALSALVHACLPDAPDVVDRALEAGAGTTIDEHLLALLAALSGEDVSEAPAPANPYKGLRAFNEADAADFFGRTALVDEMLGRLRRDDLVGRVLLVVGGSGTGKSSVVRAGLLPRVRRGELPGSDRWFVTTMLPGSAPFKELSVALRRVAVTESAGLPEELSREGGIDAVVRRVVPAGAQLLLVVDQLEELFTAAPERDQRRFLDGLFHAVDAPDSRLRVVATLRADFYDRPLGFQPFGAVVYDTTVTIPAMSAAELEVAIVEPALRVGRHIDRALVAELVGAATDEPAGLPALQFTLFDLAERAARDGDLTLTAYRELGGLDGAIAARAEALYRSLGDEDRDAVRRLFGQLVVVHPDGEPTRRRATRADVTTDDPRLDALIDRWADARLLSLDRHRQSRLPTVEPAHEALLREWPRLRRWIQRDRGALLVLASLREATASWIEVDRDSGALYRGARLQLALEALSSTPLNPQEREFLDASRAAREHEEHEVAAQMERQARTNRRLRRQLVVIGAALVVALTGGFVALDQRGEAVDEAERASDEALRADQAADRARAQALAASATNALDEDPSLAKLLAVASATLAEPSLETTATLHRAWAADRVIARPGPTYDLSVRSADIDPRGRRMVVAGAGVAEGSGKLVDVVDLAADRTAWKFELDDASAWVVSPRFTPDGDHVVAGVFWDPYNRDRVATIERGGTVEDPPPGLVGIHMWDAGTGELVARYDVGRCGGYPSAVSATHVLVRTLHGPAEVLAGCDWRYGTVGAELVDRRSGERRRLTENSGYQQRGTAMSRDGTTVAYDDIGDRHEVVVADASTGEPRLRLTPPGQGGMVKALNQDGSLLLYGDQPTEVWDVASGQQVASFDGHRGGSLYATFLPETRTVLSTGADGALREWDAGTGEQIRVYPGIAEGLVATTPDGLVLTIGHSGSNASPATLIDTGAHGELGAIDTCPGSVIADSLRVAGTLAVFHTTCDGDPGATTHVVHVREARLLHTLPGPQAPAVALSPDGTRFVRQEGEGATYGPLGVRDLRTGTQIVLLEGMCSWDGSSSLPPDRQAGCATYPDPPFGISVPRLRWSPDGTMIAAAAGTAVVVWDADTGALLHAEDPDADRIKTDDVIFSPSSDRLFAASADSRHRAISTRTWQVVSTGIGGTAVGLVEFSPDGSKTLVALQLMAHTGGSIHWFDHATQELALSKLDIHEGSLRSVAISPDGALVATAATDGIVRVWDGGTFDLLHEVPLGDTPIQGVAFIDEHHLAVTPQEGGLLVVTIDPAELLDLVRRSLTRGFTTTECTRFGFDDHCPTLADLRGQPAGADDPAVLDGSYEVSWTASQFGLALAAAGEPKIAGRATRGGYPGTYTVTFHDGRFDIVHDALGTYCAGSYTVTGDRVRLLAERSEPEVGCRPGPLLDATFVRTDDGLTFSDATAHPVDDVLLAGEPLAHVDG
jgi:DNA-binding SARP family transcriptional activator/WD40 repeat protein/tRNA A-37 threonylcarbamoyl transferase component Bud32